MHILVAAGIGLVLSTVAYVLAAKLTHQPVTWKRALAAALGGAVGGAVLAATLGAEGVAAASVPRLFGATLAGGAAGGGSEQVVKNVEDGEPLAHDVALSAAVSGATAVVFRGSASVVAPRLARVVDEILQGRAQSVTPVVVDLGTRTGRKAVEAKVKSLPEVQDASPGFTGVLEQTGR